MVAHILLSPERELGLGAKVEVGDISVADGVRARRDNRGRGG
jgi:hypothetical protein